MNTNVAIDLELPCHAWFDSEVGEYVAHCPYLNIYAQGDNAQAAFTSLEEAVRLVIRAHYQRDSLRDFLAERFAIASAMTAPVVERPGMIERPFKASVSIGGMAPAALAGACA